MTDVFDQNHQPPVPPVSSDPFADKLKSIVNDQGQPKYENTEKALEALAASQAHIKKLEDEAKAREQETQKLREEATKAEALEEIVSRLTANSQNKTKKDDPPPVDVEKVITDKVTSVLSQREAQIRANANGQDVRNSLVAKFGDVDKAREAVNSKAAELGMTNEALAALSTQNPKLVLTLFGITNTQSVSSPVVPSGTPLNPSKKEEPLKVPTTSLISGVGATDKNRKEFMQKIKDEVYKKYEVTI